MAIREGLLSSISSKYKIVYNFHKNNKVKFSKLVFKKEIIAYNFINIIKKTRLRVNLEFILNHIYPHYFITTGYFGRKSL